MGIKAFAAVIAGVFTLTGATCEKSGSDDPSKEKPGPDPAVITLEGVDTAPLTPREKKEWSQYVSEFLSPCPNVPVPISQCVKEKRDCNRCLPAAKHVLKGVKDGMSREQIEKSYKNRFDPGMVKNVPIDGSPTKGPEGAPITMVEFADFQCPHCAEFAPMLDKLLADRKGEIRFVYKLYVLGKFPQSETAARAAFAAGKQGKFWEMHHLIFGNQQRLSMQDLDAMATQVGMDVSRMHADMQSQEATDRLAKDRKLGEDLKIEGTPTIFINGRQYDGHQDMNEWINTELQMIRSAPAASASGSAAPVTSTSASASAKAPSSPVDAGKAEAGR
jgi:predicted DsbA family dithiol-disulfide isomerase